MTRLSQTRRLFMILILACFGFGCLIAIVNLASIELDELEPLFADRPHGHLRWTPDKIAERRFNEDAAANEEDDLDGRNPKIAAGLQMRQNAESYQKKNEPNYQLEPELKVNEQKVDTLQKQEHNDLSDFPEPNYNIHVFYYPWYGNPETDGKYLHWNHGYIEHWNLREAKKWPTGRHQPPDDIGANFYPQLGCYSSSDPKVIDDHMKQIRSAGIGVLVISWYPKEKSDAEGIPSDSLLPLILDTAQKYNVKVAIHSEPYKTRDDQTLHEDMKYLINQYGSHPAFYKYTWNGKKLPLIYVYDSYLVEAKKWKELLTPGGKHSIRGTKYDAIFIGLLVEAKHKTEITKAGFDGFYTYFATNGFTYGSTYQHWKEFSSFADISGLLFIPSIGPGYIDTSVRPWNAQNTRKRINGQYYQNAFIQALAVKPQMISITSFNEWHEGTQIEKAIPKKTQSLTYQDYKPNGPDFYLKMTAEWSGKFSEQFLSNRDAL